MDVDLVERAAICIKIVRAMMPEADQNLVDDLSVCLMFLPSRESQKMYDHVCQHRDLKILKEAT